MDTKELEAAHSFTVVGDVAGYCCAVVGVQSIQHWEGTIHSVLSVREGEVCSSILRHCVLQVRKSMICQLFVWSVL